VAIIFIRAHKLDRHRDPHCETEANAYNGTLNDAGGGGGAGGTIVILTGRPAERAGLDPWQANGGRGGDAWDVQPYSPGSTSWGRVGREEQGGVIFVFFLPLRPALSVTGAGGNGT